MFGDFIREFTHRETQTERNSISLFFLFSLTIQVITLCKINLAPVFVCVRPTISGFHCQHIASRYKRRSLEKKLLVKQSRMIKRSVCTSVTSVFKTSGRKGHF